MDADLSAWRLALHASHLARITAEPDAPTLVERPRPAPVHVVLLDPDDVPIDPTIAGAEPLWEPDGPRSFDWNEHRSPRLRRSA